MNTEKEKLTVRLNNVTKIIKKTVVLDNIEFTFEAGRIYGIEGINGSGKTMLMRVVSGLIYPTSGSVVIRDCELGKQTSFPESIGILIENPVFIDTYTGFDNLKMLADLSGRANEEQIKQALERVGLDPKDRRKYRKYSLGMKQRLGIAATIMEQPEIILWDEPLNALDADGVRLFDQIVKEEKERGALIIMTCHEREKINVYADELIHIENGKLVQNPGN